MQNAASSGSVSRSCVWEVPSWRTLHDKGSHGDVFALTQKDVSEKDSWKCLRR